MSFDERKKPLPAVFHDLPDSATLGTPELCRLFDCCEETILNWIKRGHLPKPVLRGKAHYHLTAYGKGGLKAPRIESKTQIFLNGNRFSLGSLRKVLGQSA